MVFLPWTGIQAAYAEEATSPLMAIVELYKALGIVFFIAAIPGALCGRHGIRAVCADPGPSAVFIIFLASFKTAVPISVAALVIVVALFIQGAAYLDYPNVDLTKACGGLFIAIGVILVSWQRPGTLDHSLTLPRTFPVVLGYGSTASRGRDQDPARHAAAPHGVKCIARSRG